MQLPWISEAEKVIGLHEVRDLKALSAWLKSDGATLGNPSKMPEGLDPGRYYYRQTTFYEACPWQHDGKPPVSSVSPLIMLEITP